jgi:hypothetical protein
VLQRGGDEMVESGVKLPVMFSGDLLVRTCC